MAGAERGPGPASGEPSEAVKAMVEMMEAVRAGGDVGAGPGRMPDPLQLGVEAQRRAAARDASQLPALADVLRGAGNQLGQQGRDDEALAALQEATAIYRRLVDAASPESTEHLSGLSMTLTALGVRMARTGLVEEALAVADESVAAARRLARAKASSWVPHLPAALWGSALIRWTAGSQHEAALAAVDEAIADYEAVRRRGPEGFTEIWGGELEAAYLVRADLLRATGHPVQAWRQRQAARHPKP